VSRKPVTKECRTYLRAYVSRCDTDHPGRYRGRGDARRPAARFTRRTKLPISPARTAEETAAPNARIAA
jgi:hypothetical protein